MRKFTYSDERSHKFWHITLEGTKVTVNYGRQGTDGQTNIKQFNTEHTVQKEHDKLIQQKLKKGYVEVTDGTAPPTLSSGADSTLETLEQALLDNPNDLGTHMAYADYLHEKGDPRGEYIQTQIALEDPNRSAADRKKLKAVEKELEEKHLREWLGELAPGLLDRKPHKYYEWKFQISRGWLDTLIIPNVSANFTHRLAHADEARLLQRLVISEPDSDYEEEEDLNIPEHIEEWDTAIYPLVHATNLKNVRVFELGEIGDWQDPEEHFSCHTWAETAVGVIKQMPKLEELYLGAHGIDTEQLFGLRTLHNLRILLVYHESEYPLTRLANNPSLGNLTHLLLYPHALDDDEPYLSFDGIRKILRSKHLTSLTHLQFRQSSFGDDGCKELVKSGRLKQLKFLDLRVGTITDEGAKTLAECDDISNLEYLNVSVNNMTEDGIKLLTEKVPHVIAIEQYEVTGSDDWEQWEHFMEGDYE